MSLLLTKTCEYAILVALQKGRYFAHSTEHEICVQSKLELRLPAAVDDLIPPTTLISTAPATISREGIVTFDTTLAYLISSKLLHRLRAHDADITLTLNAVGVDAGQQRIGTVRLRVSEAKMVVHHGGHMDKVNRFVADRGDWQTLSDGRRNKEQLKAGLFIVAMPTEKGQQQQQQQQLLRASSPAMASSPSSALLELKSLGDLSNASTPLLFSDSVTTTTATTLLSSPSSHSFIQNTHHHRQPVDLNIDQLANEFRNVKLSSHHQQQQPLHPQPTVSTTKRQLQQQQQQQQQPVPRTLPKKPRYHQIGKGTKEYTFYFSIIETDYVDLMHLSTLSVNRYSGSSNSRPGTAASLLRPQPRGVAHKPFFTYSILSDVVNCPASSISHSSSTATWPTCFHLRGHLVDIQNWLDDLRFLEVSLVMKNTDPQDAHSDDGSGGGGGTRSRATRRLFSDRMNVVGMAHIPLSNLAFYRSSRDQAPRHHSYYDRHSGKDPNFVERTFPVHDLNHHRWWEQQQSAPKHKMIAKVTVRLGLVSGWWTGDAQDDDDQADHSPQLQPRAKKGDSTTPSDDSMHRPHHKRHHSSRRSSTKASKRSSGHHDLLDWLQKKRAKLPQASPSS